MSNFMDFYDFSKKMNDWRYECSRDIDRLDKGDFFDKARAYSGLSVSSCDISGAFGKLCGALVSYAVNFVPFRSSIEHVDREISETFSF